MTGSGKLRNGQAIPCSFHCPWKSPSDSHISTATTAMIEIVFFHSVYERVNP
jgi:hypothetical protein